MADESSEHEKTIGHTMADPLAAAGSPKQIDATVGNSPAGSPEPLESISSADPADFRGLRIGDYTVLEEVGRGGMGIIFKARHNTLGRIVALKLIRAGELADDEQIRRFQAEAQAAAQLDHPGIITVYETGRHGPHHFMAMAFVEGRSLNHRLAQWAFPPPEAARCIQRAAEAVQYAHDRDIIHRDIKPQNILYGEDGQPRIADFGLAKKQHADHSLTATGAVLGTPAYMPPEQASGKMESVGKPADIYSLGATLYFLLTGKPPFEANNVVDLLMKVLDDEPVVPREINPNVPRDLEAICLKCMSKQPESRYESAAALAEDLRRFQDGETISISSGDWTAALVQTLTRSRDDVKYKDWAIVLFEFAAIVWLTDFVVFLRCLYEWPYGHLIIGTARVIQFVSMGWICWRHRVFQQGAANASAQHMLSLWIGFLVACNVTAVTVFQSAAVLHPDKQVELRVCYPYFASLSGLLFFALGRNFWGACYAFGVLFFVMALAMPHMIAVAPLLFGTVWAGILITLGVRLRRLAIQDAETVVSNSRRTGSGPSART